MSLYFDDEVRAAYQQLKPNTWTLFSLITATNTLKISEQGQGLSDCLENFEDSKIQFAIVSVPANALTKLVLICWCGEGVPVLSKSKFHNHVNDVTRFFSGFHVQINARSQDDLDEKAIMKKVLDSAGSKYNQSGSADVAPPARKVIQPIPSVTKPIEKPSTIPTAFPKPIEKAPVKTMPVKEAPVFERVNPISPPVRTVEPPPLLSRPNTEAPQKPVFPRQNAPVQPFTQPKPTVRPWNPVSDSQDRVRLERERREREDAELRERSLREEQERLDKLKISRDDQEEHQIRQQQQWMAQQQQKQASQERIDWESSQEALARQQQEMERQERQERIERERQDRERQERFDRERQDRERQERERQERQDRERQERQDRERQDRERQERMERERREQEREQELLRQEREAERRQQQKEQERRQEEERLRQEEQSNQPGASGLKAMVLYDYEPEESNEIALVQNDIVQDIVQLDEGWWQGKNSSGQIGLFPANYVQLIEDDQPPPVSELDDEPPASKGATCLYDYDATEPNELSFVAGDRINNIEFVSDDWWQGSLNGFVGLFPSNYVELDGQ